MEREVK